MMDLEMTRLAAQGMSYRVLYDKSVGEKVYLDCEDQEGQRLTMLWSPLLSGDQVISLLEKRNTIVLRHSNDRFDDWTATDMPTGITMRSPSIHRAVVSCFAHVTKFLAEQPRG